MLPDILLWNKIGRIVMRLAEKLHISPERALDIVYRSKACQDLHNPSSDLYTFGDLYVVDEILNELKML